TVEAFPSDILCEALQSASQLPDGPSDNQPSQRNKDQDWDPCLDCRRGRYFPTNLHLLRDLHRSIGISRLIHTPRYSPCVDGRKTCR
ncbi:hypothetical protein ABTM70_19990, partial [Acinetobacter baumannii]